MLSIQNNATEKQLAEYMKIKGYTKYSDDEFVLSQENTWNGYVFSHSLGEAPKEILIFNLDISKSRHPYYDFFGKARIEWVESGSYGGTYYGRCAISAPYNSSGTLYNPNTLRVSNISTLNERQFNGGSAYRIGISSAPQLYLLANSRYRIICFA